MANNDFELIYKYTKYELSNISKEYARYKCIKKLDYHFLKVFKIEDKDESVSKLLMYGWI